MRVRDGVQRHILEAQPVLRVHPQARARRQQLAQAGIGQFAQAGIGQFAQAGIGQFARPWVRRLSRQDTCSDR
jgi:hypothetical protein